MSSYKFTNYRQTTWNISSHSTSQVPKTFNSPWEHFTKGSKGSNVAYCKLCPTKKEIKTTNSGTTGMIRHLQNIHRMSQTRVQIRHKSSESSDDNDSASVIVIDEVSWRILNVRYKSRNLSFLKDWTSIGSQSFKKNQDKLGNRLKVAQLETEYQLLSNFTSFYVCDKFLRKLLNNGKLQYSWLFGKLHQKITEKFLQLKKSFSQEENTVVPFCSVPDYGTNDDFPNEHADAKVNIWSAALSFNEACQKTWKLTEHSSGFLHNSIKNKRILFTDR